MTTIVDGNSGGTALTSGAPATLPAGTASAAPLTLTAGTNLTTAAEKLAAAGLTVADLKSLLGLT